MVPVGPQMIPVDAKMAKKLQISLEDIRRVQIVREIGTTVSGWKFNQLLFVVLDFYKRRILKDINENIHVQGWGENSEEENN